MPAKLALYANVGPELTHYDVDVEACALTRRGTVTLPAKVQYVWPHANRRFLYVSTSDAASGLGPQGTCHHVTGFRIDPETGALTQHGESIPLPHRPIHHSTDVPSEHVLVAFSNPSGVRVYKINPDGTPGAEVVQAAPIDPGIYAHQVMAMPDNRAVILVTRGHDARNGKSEEPGALKVFSFKDGQLGDEQSIAPGGGFGFGPRHLDFHRSKPWVYVSLERQNQVDLFERVGDSLAPEPKFRKHTLTDISQQHRYRQMVGTVHVHPNGNFLYVANRYNETVDFNGQPVLDVGENSLAVFSIDQTTGEPTLIQHMDTHGVHPRTFHIDPSGRMLVVGHIMGSKVRDGDSVRTVPARLTTFRIGDDGKLTFARAYDIDVNGQTIWWSGMVAW